MSRSSLSSEEQTKELRGRARRRLIGALALVIAAVIVVPMLLDTEPVADHDATPLVVPALPRPAVQADDVPPVADQSDADIALPVPDVGLPGSDPADTAAADAETTPADSSPTDAAAPPHTEASAPKPRVAEKPVEPTPTPAPGGVKRTDDGSVARALLEGRQPGQAAVANETASGNYVLQIAAYSTDNDAQARRDKLTAAGVTNAYVESGVSSGKATFRLRVGPFPTREAAQAAQARLRALGYDNGFISTK